MGYQEPNYIIENDVDEMEQPVIQRPAVSIRQNAVSDDFQPIEKFDASQNIIDEIHESAVQEGLVQENEAPFGGEGNPTPEAVITDFIGQERSEGAQEHYEEYADNKVKKTKKIMATREILTGMTKRLLTVTVPVVLPVEQYDGSVKDELVDMQLKVKRLTESQVNHLFNRQMANKEYADFTPEEIEEDKHFRSKFLETAIVDPKMSADVWYNEVPAIALGTIYNKVQDVLSAIDNTELFQ